MDSPFHALMVMLSLDGRNLVPAASNTVAVQGYLKPIRLVPC